MVQCRREFEWNVTRTLLAAELRVKSWPERLRLSYFAVCVTKDKSVVVHCTFSSQHRPHARMPQLFQQWYIMNSRFNTFPTHSVFWKAMVCNSYSNIFLIMVHHTVFVSKWVQTEVRPKNRLSMFFVPCLCKLLHAICIVVNSCDYNCTVPMALIAVLCFHCHISHKV